MAATSKTNCLLATPITVTRSAIGTYVDGRWVAGATSSVSITGSVQPAKMRHEELLRLPEGDRNRSAIRVYSKSELLSNDESTGQVADVVAWQGEQYEVQKVDVWAEGIAHYKALCLRVART